MMNEDRNKFFLFLTLLVANVVWLGVLAHGQEPDAGDLALIHRMPKVHYSVPLRAVMLEDPRVDEFVRITGAATVHPFWTSPEELNQCMALCKTHGAELAVYFSPLLRDFNRAKWWAKHRGESFNAFPLTVQVDGPFAEEVETLRLRFLELEAIASLRRVHVGAVIYDHEAMVPDDVTEGVVRWKLEQYYDVAKAAFPHATVIWYGRGGLRQNANNTGWATERWTSVDVPGDSVSVSLYWLTETHHWREAARLTAAANPGSAVVPFVSIGWQWTRDRPLGRKGTHDFSTVASFKLGAEVNRTWFSRQPERFMPNDRFTKGVVMYWTQVNFPPAFWSHFEAYASGATDVR